MTVERKGALAQLFGVQMMRGPAFLVAGQMCAQEGRGERALR